jgi:hypothetical protein
MEKFFSFNKFFLFFCVVFILEWLLLQAVSYMRLTGMAKLDGERILSWSWPDKDIKSVVQIYDTKILKREPADAVVKVLARQAIQPINSLAATTATATTATIPETAGQTVNSRLASKPNVEQQKTDLTSQPSSQCTVTLTYYRTNYQWYLGKVDWQ